MSKLYFKFGAMGSSKTANALMTKYNYEEKDKKVWLIKPSLDTRSDYVDENGKTTTVIKSRIGLSSAASAIKPEESVCVALENVMKQQRVDAIICDECQFLSERQVDELKHIAETFDIPVLCFGLRSDFRTKLFSGSKRLFEIADSISEIKSICRCGRKAIVNARFDGKGNVITEGDQVEIGGNEKYEGLCWHCWQKKINIKK